MTKTELVKLMAKETNLTAVKMTEVIDLFLEHIQTETIKGNDVTFKGFGVFKVGNRSARTGRNPRTGESVEIEAKRTVKFKPSKEWKEQMNG